MFFIAYGILLKRIAEDRDADPYIEFTVLGRKGRKEYAWSFYQGISDPR